MEMYATYGAALTASPEALAVMQKYFPEVFSVWNNDLRGTGKDPAADRKLLIEKHTEKIVCPAVEEKKPSHSGPIVNAKRQFAMQTLFFAVLIQCPQKLSPLAMTRLWAPIESFLLSPNEA